MRVEDGPLSLRLPESADRLASVPNHFADSGYGSSLEACSCTSCHYESEIDDVINGSFTSWQVIVSLLTSRKLIQGNVATASSSAVIHGITVWRRWGLPSTSKSCPGC